MKFIYIALVICSVSLHAQFFTKITDGDPVNDGGDSRAVNWIDYDNDGDLDLFVTNGPQAGQNNFLYQNNDDGTFTKITSVVVANDGKASDGSTWGDYNNDGYLDLFVANWYGQNNLLYLNKGDATFSFESSLAPSLGSTFSETGSWGDYNNDGYLDLYVCNSWSNLRNQLFLNNQDGTFTSITTGAPVTDMNYSRNADWIDINNDGIPDLFVTNEENQNNALYFGNMDGSFTKITNLNIVSDGGNSTSSNWEDINNDGYFDLFVANWGNQNNFLYMNNGDGTFTKVTSGPVATDGGSSFGSCFGDINNDGYLDFLVTNAFTGSNQTNNFLYINNGDGSFTKDTSLVSNDGGWSYGCAFGDYDNDGYLDLFVAKCFQGNENNVQFKNNGGDNNWLKLNLVGIKSNYSAIGAVVKLKAEISGESFWQMRRVAGQNGYCGQNLQIHFGLGDAEIIDSILIEWPSGVRQFIINHGSNQALTITEDTTLTSVNNEIESIKDYGLLQNYPNPFNPATRIDYRLETGAEVKISVYSQLGELIEKMYEGYSEAGSHSIEFNGKHLTSGVYFYVLQTPDFIQSRKMILLQ